MNSSLAIRYKSFLDTRKHSVAGEFVLFSDYLYDICVDGAWYRVAAPRGFITDFASIPKAAQVIPHFGVNDNSAFAAVPHDFHYSCRGALHVRDLDSGDLTDITLTREQCDELLYQGLIAVGYSIVDAMLFYDAVRIGGQSYWDKRAGGLTREYDFVPDDFWNQQPEQFFSRLVA